MLTLNRLRFSLRCTLVAAVMGVLTLFVLPNRTTAISSVVFIASAIYWTVRLKKAPADLPTGPRVLTTRLALTVGVAVVITASLAFQCIRSWH